MTPGELLGFSSFCRFLIQKQFGRHTALSAVLEGLGAIDTDQCPWPCSSLPRQRSLQAQANVTEPWPDSLRTRGHYPGLGSLFSPRGAKEGAGTARGVPEIPGGMSLRDLAVVAAAGGHSRAPGGHRQGGQLAREHPGQWETRC